MAQNRLGGQGLSLPYPQALYPTLLVGSAPQPATNAISLDYGAALVIPPGDWMVSGAPVQWLDPVTNSWIYMGSSSTTNGWYIHSDGQNFRVINPQGIVTGAAITAAGSGYTQSTVTVTASAGGSTWQPIIGGAVSLALPSGGGGSGYTVEPIVVISAPPSPGVQATAKATISGGAVTGFTVTNAGAGYTVAPTVSIYPNPFDPNFGAITAATATASLTGAGTLTGLLCTWGGTPQASQTTLTITGAGGSGATATTVWVAESAVDTVYMQPL